MGIGGHLRALASPAQSPKAWVGAVIAFLAPLAALLSGHDAVTWRTFAAAAIAGLVAGVSIYATSPGAAGQPQPRGEHEAGGPGA